MALDPIVLLTARYVVAGIFTISAFAKLMRFHDFVAVVAGYRLLPSWAVPPAVVAIPLLEALVSLGLWTQALPAVSSGAAGALLAIFTVAIVVNLVRGRTEIDCGCLGPLLRQRIGWWMVIRNGVLMGLVGYGTSRVGPSALAESGQTAEGSFWSLSRPNVPFVKRSYRR